MGYKLFKRNLKAFKGKRLYEIIDYTKMHCFFNCCRVVGGSYHNNFGSNFFLADFFQGFNSVHVRHEYIKDNQVNFIGL